MHIIPVFSYNIKKTYSSSRLNLINILFTEKLIMGQPVKQILNDIQQTSQIDGDVKRIHLLNNRDIHNIKRDFNIITHSNKNKKCTNDDDYFNKYCKTIHTYAKEESDNCKPNQTLIQELEYEYIDVGIGDIQNIIQNKEKLKDKVITIFDMIECANINEEDEEFINIHCDKIISKLKEKTNISNHHQLIEKERVRTKTDSWL